MTNASTSRKTASSAAKGGPKAKAAKPAAPLHDGANGFTAAPAGMPPGAPPGAQVGPGALERETTEQLRKLFEVWVDSELKAQVVIFFNNNPGVVETVEGLAKRLAINAALLRDAVADHVRLGLLEERKLGDKTVIVFNRNRRNEIQDVVLDALKRRKEAN